MRPEDKQEQVSLAVLHATCAKAGFAFQISERIQDNWGWDAMAHVREKLDPASTLWDFKMKFQLKATRQQLTFAERRYSFPIEVPQYNRLRAAAGSDAPTYLVVFQMPADEAEWLDATPEQLVLRRCLLGKSAGGGRDFSGDKDRVLSGGARAHTGGAAEVGAGAVAGAVDRV